jgi:hypothetical protein
MLGLNVNKLTSMLSKLADNALQGYASMHKSNPYVLSLAVAEANRRKELRASGQMRGAGQPQPKVADVAIANMASSPEEQGYGGLPEQQGIGALPARNMQGMADGGIVGYDDQEPVQMMAKGGRANIYGDGMSMFDSALDQEKITNPAERAFLKAIHFQESSGKKTAKTSNRDAHGAMQVLPSTFKSVADPGMDINNPIDNMRAGIRYGRQGFRAAGGDPILAGAFYYGGPGGMAKLKRGVIVRDPKNPNAPSTLEYGEDVKRRMQRFLGGAQPPAQAQPQRPAPSFIEPPAREMPPMLFAAAPQSEGIPSHSEAPIGDVRMGQHAGIEDDTRYRAAEQAMASAQQPTQMMAGGGVARFASGGIDDLDPKKLRERAEKRLRLEQLREGRLVPQGPYSPLPSQADTVRPSSSANSIRSVNPAGVAGYGFGLYHGSLNEGEDAELERRRAMGPTLNSQAQGETFDPATSRSMLNRTEQSARTNPAVYGAPNTATGSDSGGAGTGGGGAGDVPSYAAPSMDIPGMFRSAMTDAQGMDNPFAKDIEAMGKERVKAAQQDVAGLEAIHARFDDIFKGRKERMGTREQEVSKLEGEAERMALINFGLAMAKTPGKGVSGLLSGLTAGADAGSKEYVKGMDKFRAAQEKLNDAKDRLEDLEANRAELNARELHKGRMAVRATMVDVQKDMINANMEMYKLNRADSKDLVKAQMELGLEQLRQSGANARSAATLNTPDRLVFNQLLKDSGNDAVKAAESLQKMKTEKFNVYDAYSKYLQAFAGKDTLKGPDDFDVFAKRFIPTVTPSKNTTIRTQPGG